MFHNIILDIKEQCLPSLVYLINWHCLYCTALHYLAMHCTPWLCCSGCLEWHGTSTVTLERLETTFQVMPTEDADKRTGHCGRHPHSGTVTVAVAFSITIHSA